MSTEVVENEPVKISVNPLVKLGLDKDQVKKVGLLKDKGNPVFTRKFGEVTFVYFGLLREDYSDIKVKAIKEGEKLTKDLSDESTDEDRAKVFSRLEDLEDDFLITYAVIHPSLTLNSVSKMTTGLARSLRTAIMQASGEADVASEPVQL